MGFDLHKEMPIMIEEISAIADLRYTITLDLEIDTSLQGDKVLTLAEVNTNRGE